MLRRAAIALCLSVASCAWAQTDAKDYPNKPVRWIVTFVAGASNDIVARLMAAKLGDALGQQILIDNRAGAGGLLGAEIVAKAPPDGYTLLLANPGPNINAPLMAKKPPYKVEDFAPVALFGYIPLIIAVHPAFPVSNPQELIAHLKANPGRFSWGSGGTGSGLHIGLALLQTATGIDVIHIPYKGTAPALTDLVGGQIQVMYTTKVSADGQIKAGRVRVIGVASAKRSPALPDVPTLAEHGIKDAEAVTWFGMAVPAKTPRAIIDRLNSAVNRILAMPEIRKRFDDDGVEVQGGTPEQFAAFIRREAARIEKLVKTGALARE